MYKSIDVNFNDLILDEENPRFVTNENSKLSYNEIMNYLIKYENIIELAESICEFGGLVPGERLLVLKENEKYIVLEGNRRVAAMSLIINPKNAIENLSLSTKVLERINKLNRTNQLIQSLSKFPVDYVTSREDAIYSLTERHIDGIKRWSQISKMYFYQQHFSLGKSLKELEKYTGEASRSIADTLRKYNYLRFVLRAYRNKYPSGKYHNSDIETQIPTELIIQRIFNSLKDRLQFKFDEDFNFQTEHYGSTNLITLNNIFADLCYLYWDLEKINTRNLNKVEDFNNVFFNNNHINTTDESLEIGRLINQLENNLKQSVQLKIDIDNQNKEDQKQNDKKPDKKNKKDDEKDESQKKEPPKLDNDDLEYKLYLDVKTNKQKIKIYNDYDLLNMVKNATDSHGNDLMSKVIFKHEDDSLIDGSIFSGIAADGIYYIQVVLQYNEKIASKGIILEVYIPKTGINTKTIKNNELFTSVTAFSLDEQINIDINSSVNGLIEEIQLLNNPEKFQLMIASSIRQLIELSVVKIINDKELRNKGNPKNNLYYLVNEVFKDRVLFEDICNGENKLNERATKNLINSINTNQLWDYLNLITHDSYSSIYSELVEKINKQITPLLVVFHNYLKL